MSQQEIDAEENAVDWFERLTGFRETTYAETQARLSIAGGRLRNLRTGGRCAVGTLALPSLAELRVAAGALRRSGRPRLSVVQGDVRALHGLAENHGALFQVASQFNMLEMVGPDVTPEDGVTRYVHDRTQGPACAMAAGAATIYRNYLVPVDGHIGQTADRQLDGLADLGATLARRLGRPLPTLWTMSNGYALATTDGLAAITEHLRTADEAAIDALRALLRVGLHTDVEVTDGSLPGPRVSQIFCSALPVAYGDRPGLMWGPFARLVLEAAYEATLLAGLLSAAQGASNRVLLTRLGGGAFGNDDAWIDAAILRALRIVSACDLDVAIVSFGRPSPSLRELIARFASDTYFS